MPTRFADIRVKWTHRQYDDLPPIFGFASSIGCCRPFSVLIFIATLADINPLYKWLYTLLLFINNACTLCWSIPSKLHPPQIFIIIVLIIQSIITLFNQYVLVGLQFYNLQTSHSTPTYSDCSINRPWCFMVWLKRPTVVTDTQTYGLYNALESVTLTRALCIKLYYQV